MRQIHQLTQVLVRVIETVVGLRTQNKADQAVEITNKMLTEQLDLDISDLLEMDEDEMLQKLKAHPGMNHENLEYIAELASVALKEEIQLDSETLWQRSLLIYTHIESDGEIYSIDRNHKIKEIEERLSGNNR